MIFHVSSYRFEATHPVEFYNDRLGVNDKENGARVGAIYDTIDQLYYETVLDDGQPISSFVPTPPPPPPLPLPRAGTTTNPPPQVQDQSEDTSSDDESPETQSSTAGSQFYPQPQLQPSPNATLFTTQQQQLDHSAGVHAPTGTPSPYETPSTYQHLMPGLQQCPNPYQALLKERAATHESSSASDGAAACNAEQKTTTLPSIRAGYKLLRIRDNENEYHILQHHTVPESSSQAITRPPTNT